MSLAIPIRFGKTNAQIFPSLALSIVKYIGKVGMEKMSIY